MFKSWSNVDKQLSQKFCKKVLAWIGEYNKFPGDNFWQIYNKKNRNPWKLIHAKIIRTNTNLHEIYFPVFTAPSSNPPHGTQRFHILTASSLILIHPELLICRRWTSFPIWVEDQNEFSLLSLSTCCLTLQYSSRGFFIIIMKEQKFLDRIKSVLNWWTRLLKLFSHIFFSFSILHPRNYIHTPFHLFICHYFWALPVYFDTANC